VYPAFGELLSREPIHPINISSFLFLSSVDPFGFFLVRLSCW
jgi:hypothetical protein